MNKVLISIIMPVYNSELYLNKSIESVLNQTLKNFELIVIDDNSTDKSRSILEKYVNKDQRVRYFINSSKGVSDARNLGIKMAAGDYITFIDADDYLAKDALDRMYNYIVKYSCDICMAGFYRENNSKKEKVILPYEDGHIFNNDEIKSEIIPDMIYIPKANKNKKKIMGSVWRLLIKKNLIVSNCINFNSKIHIAEDLLFCIEVFSKCNSLVTMKDCFYHYVRYGNTSLERYRENFLEESLYFYKEFEAALRKAYIFEENKKNFGISKCNMYTTVISNNFRYDSPNNYKLRNEIIKRVRYILIHDELIKDYINRKEISVSKYIVLKLIKYNMCNLLILLFYLKEKVRMLKMISLATKEKKGKR